MRASRVCGMLGSALLIFVAGCGGGSGGSSGTGVTAAGVGTSGGSTPLQATSAPAAANNDPIVIEPKVSQGSNRDVDPFQARSVKDAPVPGQVVLQSLPPEGRTVQKAAPSMLGSPTRVGVAREVSETATTAKVSGMMGWSPTSTGGKVAAMRFQSSGAEGVRIGLLVESLPLGSVVRFYADGADKAYVVPAQEILTTIQRNLDAGDATSAARTYWSPNLGGAAITVEVDIPPGATTDSVQVSVPRLSHILVDVRKLDSIQKVGEAGSCTLDVSCSASYSEVSKSVAMMDFVGDGTNGTVNGSTYVCTGTLLNDRTSSGIPYFLSANHCISNQTVASTLYTFWFYKSASCNSTQVSPALAAMTSGATLLYQSAATDTSFMRLNSMPPAGAVYAGSSSFAPDLYADVYGVSHPQGDLQKYSSGDFMGQGSCANGACSSSLTSGANFLRAVWTLGTTESGSSGSGLFMKMNGKDYLVGQLYGGYASCSNRFGTDYYGRFDKAYQAALSQWLGAPAGNVREPIYRLYNRRTQTHFYTPDPAERDRTVERSSEYSYDGIAFYAYASTGLASDPVYRFYNTRTGVHFYTINATERANIQNTLPWYSDEGMSWIASVSSQNQAVAMYRFYNTATQTHFYTINEAERDNIRQRYPQYSYEGVGYYAWLSP
ncbi:serine protease [Variovorax fucosicus]|uniref:serine protease n=1 Tax=Variovorax fucosicus TaxID=3053517 RepID=UPI002575B981|nr:serine protease [Variovorax sp. J22G47]MDM0054396.1 serine protease [Variovorax sp. J22G47]